jgi:putative RecB family exonuclease
MPTFSHSKIGSFENCKLQFKYQYLDRIKVEVEDTIETYLGSRVHEALEKLYKDRRFEKYLSQDELIDYYNQNWKENWKDSIKIVSTEYRQENYRKMGETYLKDYYNRYKPFDMGKILGLETQDFLPLDEAGKYTYHIRIDRLMDMGNGLYEVHDYKTNRSLTPQEELDQDRQLAMYALWVRRQFRDLKKVRLVWHFVAFDKEMESFRTEEQLERLRVEVLKKIHKIESTRDFPPKVSNLCQWCRYQEICPMWKHEKELEAKPVNEYLEDPGLKLVDEYVRVKTDLDNQKKEAEEKLEKLKEAILRFCEKEGVQAVVGTENKITVRTGDSVKFPAKNSKERDELIEYLKKEGKFDSVMDLDLFALKKAFENREWPEDVLKDLERYATLEKTYSLSVAKK